MKPFVSVLAILTVVLHSGSANCAANESEERAITLALDTYTKACESRDFERLSSVFAHDDDIVLINVGTSPRWLVGWPAVAELYKEIFSASDSLRMQHTNVSIKMLAAGSAACVTCNQKVDWTFQGKAYGYEGIRMTCVLEKQHGHWRIVHGHWSLPSTEEPKVRKPDRTGRTPRADTPAATNRR